MGCRRFCTRASLAAVSLVPLAMSAAGHAQSSQGQKAVSADAPGEAGIADIVVTAQKRSERLQDVPVAVAAVSPLTLERTGVQTTDSLPSLVPGLVINNSPTAFRPFLRGVGTAAAAAGNENSVSTYIDNIYLTSMNAGLLNLASIDSIEVLKGPQGTLFGRNATGGVINIKTLDPSQTFGGKANVSYGNYQTFTAIGYVTGGLTSTIAADLSVYYRDQAKGYGTNIQTGDDINKGHQFTIRSKIKFTPTPVDTITLSGDYTENRDSGPVFRPLPGTAVAYGTPPYQFRGNSAWDIDMAADPFGKAWFAGGSAIYVHEMPWATLSSFTAYREDQVHYGWNSIPVPANAARATVNQPEKQFSEELQLSSPHGSKVSWIAGFYYLNASVRFAPFNITGLTILSPTGVPIEQNFVMKQTIKTPAVYGQVTTPIEALGETNLTAGLRYTMDRRAIVGEIDIVPQANPSAAPVAVNPTNASKTFRTFTWRLGLDHHFSRDNMVYITYNRGFKAGSYNSIPPGGPNAQATDPEYLDAYEIGSKNTLFDGAATLNISGFYYEYKNLQVTIFNNTAAVTVNAAAANIKGIDVDFNAKVSRNVRVAFGVELLDPKFINYPNGPILTPVPAAQGGGVSRTFGDLSGKRLPFASNAVVNGAIFYELPTSVGKFDANLNVTYNSGFTFEPSEAARQKAFADIAATLGWTLPNGTTRISGYGRNLANEKVIRTYAGGANAGGANPGGYIEAQYRDPRTYGVAISQKF